MEITRTTYKGLTWHDIVAEDEDALIQATRHLREGFSFHELALEDCLTASQRSKVDDYDDYIFLVVHLPRFNKRTRRLETRRVTMFVGTSYVVTLHDGTLKPLVSLHKNMAEHTEKQKYYLGKGAGFFLYEILRTLFAYCFPILDKTSTAIAELEQDILNDEGDVVQDHLKEIMLVKRNIIRFRRIILPFRSVIKGAENAQQRIIPNKLDVYFDDVLDQIEHIWDLLTSYKELIEALQETNESIISNRTNNVIKTLTLFSVTLLPLTFITGLYGMNLPHLPFSGSPAAFNGIIAVMGAIVIIILAYSKYRKWL